MTTELPSKPLVYVPSYEKSELQEDDVHHALVKTLRGIFRKTFKAYGCPVRSVHAKGLGLIVGELEVLAHQADVLKQGVFTDAGTLPVIMRFSTIPGDVLDDDVSVPRGLALKLVGVEGERLPDSQEHVTQDFLFANGPAFGAPNPRTFLRLLKLLALTTDRLPVAKKWLSRLLRPLNRFLGRFGIKSTLLATLGGHPTTHVLGETYYTQAPILYGPYMAKLALVPIAPALVALKDRPVNVKDNPSGLRDAVVAFFAGQGAEWELRVQLCTDITRMPVEDASVPWPEDRSPYVTVAILRASPQQAWSARREAKVERGMAFNPWHGITAHRPIGAVMRARRMAYRKSAQWRAENGDIPIMEPDSIKDLD